MPALSTLLLLTIAGLVVPLRAQSGDDQELRAAVDRFFTTQQAEDIPAYLALWSRTAQRPTAEQLKFIFDSGEDTFTEIAIVRTIPAGDKVRVRVSARRERRQGNAVRADGTPRTFTSVMLVGLTFVREVGEWKLLREGPAADDLALALLEAPSAAAREELLVAEPDLVGLRLIEALSRRGDAAAQMQAFAQALVVYERVLEVARRVGDRKSEGQALQNIANAHYFQRNFPKALEHYEQRLAVERARADDEGMAAALGGIGTIRYSFADYTEALTRYRQALAIHEALGDHAGLATTLISTGNVLYLQGDFPAAIADYRRSRDLNRKLFNLDGVARALEGIGRVFVAQGDYAQALEAFAGVLEEGKARNDPRRQGFATQSLGDVHFRLGNLETARANFDASRGHYEKLKDLANVGRVWQATALTDLVAGRFAVAEKEYTSSATVCATATDAECVARAIVGLAFAQSAQDKFVEAIASYRKAIDAFAALGNSDAAARSEVGLSQALSGNKDYQSAIDAATRARQTAVALGSDDVLWRALVAEARAVRRLGEQKDPDRAVGIVRAAVSAVERMQQASLERPGNRVPSDTSMAFASLAVMQAARGDAAGAFDTVQRLRANDLRVALATNERDIARGMTPEERESERLATAEVVSLDAQVTRERDLPRPDTARLAALTARLSEAGARRTLQTQRLFERLPALRGWRGLAPAVTAPDVATLLAPDETLIEFVVDDEDVLIVTAARGAEAAEFAAHLTAMTRRTLADRVARLVQPVLLQSVSGWKTAAAEFAGAVLPPAVTARMSAATRLLIVPHEMLWRVPFAAIPAADGYVGDRPTITYTGSLASARQPAVSSATNARFAILALAAPEIAEPVRERITQTAPDWILRAPDAAEREARQAAAVHGDDRAVVLARAAAREAAFRSQAPGAGLLHFAAPFRINSASPLFSPVVVTAGTEFSDTTDDGAIEIREIMNLDLPARVAVFSDGAAMSMRDAPSVADIVQWGWLAAGVPSLVLPRWTGEEKSTGELLEELHRRLRAGDRPGEALRAAATVLRANPDTAAPFYWAGWMTLASRDR
jgi:tetratricopeptide (TPR) repeat protein